MDGSGTMKTRFWLRRGLALARIGFGLGLVASASLGMQTGLAASSPGYSVANVGPYGGGPPVLSGSPRAVFETPPGGGKVPYTSAAQGQGPGAVTDPGPKHAGGCPATDPSHPPHFL